MIIRKTLIAALFLTAASAFAQGAPPPIAGQNMERMALLLDLDAGQKVAVEKVLTEQREEMKALRQQTHESAERPSREERKAKLDSRRAETMEKLRPILSDVQLKKFEALTDHPPSRGMRGKSHGGNKSKE